MLIKMPKRRVAPVVLVESRILILRQQRVIPDKELAQLYSILVKRLNEQVKRNRERFPASRLYNSGPHWSHQGPEASARSAAAQDRLPTSTTETRQCAEPASSADPILSGTRGKALCFLQVYFFRCR